MSPTARRHPRRLASLALLAALAGAWLLLSGAAPAAAATLQPGDRAVVRADGDCLRLHASPALAANTVACLPEGTVVTVLADGGDADGYHWLQVSGGGATGWAVDAYLQAVAVQPTTTPTAGPTPAPTAGPTETPVPVPGSAAALPVPPVGGLTLGLAGTSDPAALAAAQTFTVESVSVFDVATQRFLTYIPGAPAFTSSLNTTNLRPSSIATIKRQGATPAATTPPTAAPRPVQGNGSALPTPLPGGLTQGVSGTNNPATLAAAQHFGVETISMLDVPSQAWLVYIPGAPAVVSTLNSGTLDVGAVVTIKSSGGGSPSPAPTPTAPPGGTPVGGYTPAPPSTATAVPGPAGNEAATQSGGNVTTAAATTTVQITYYYCAAGTNLSGVGDGGGFCGTTATGEPVHRGTASCAPSLLGQRFTIAGDPDHLVYTCGDTGAAVQVGERDIWFPDSDTGYAWWRVVGPTAEIAVVAA